MRPSEAGKLLKSEVEPRWDDLRSARVQRKVLHELKAPASARSGGTRSAGYRARSWVFAVAAVAIAAIALFALVRRADVPVPVASAPSRELTLPDGSVVSLSSGPGAPVAHVVPVLVSDERIEIEQSDGAATYVVTKRPSRTFVVRAGDVRVEVLGTSFRVEVLDGAVRVAVIEGRVQVTRGDRSAVLLGGDDVTFGEHELGRSQAPPGPAPIPTPPASATAAEPEPEPSLPEPTGSAHPRLHSAASAEADPEGTPAARLFRQADEARAAGNTDEALRLLRKLVSEYPQDSRATLALFTMGRLEQKRGNALAAANAFDAAGAVMGGEAMAEAALAYKAAGKGAQASALAAQYMKRFPDGARRAQMETLAP